MSDLLDHGQVQVIAMKKAGSSQLRKAFAEKVWEPTHLRQRVYVTLIRHPAARLVSAWNHFCRHPKELTYFGKWRPFPDWIEWVLAQAPETLDHHIAPQVPDLKARLADAPAGSKLWVGQLEQITECSLALSVFLNRHIQILDRRRHPHGPWRVFYDTPQLRRVRDYYIEDMGLWLDLHRYGYGVVTCPINWIYDGPFDKP